ncbi:MAG: radical SAM protein [Bacteroidota bacterium]
MHQIVAKSILSKVKNDSFFGLTYNMNLYRGCQHACIYCDSRSDCYKIENFAQPSIKINAINLLEKELARTKIKGTIGFGSMNDPYMPLESRYRLSRKALEIISKKHFPIHIITKSNLVIEDINLIKEISKTYAAISFSFTTADDYIAKVTEPFAPSPSLRFEAINELAKKGIYTGITLMPVLPFINDNEKSVNDIVEKAHKYGAKYIIPYFGVTLRKGSREFFFKKLDANFTGVREKYENHFENKYFCDSLDAKQLYSFFYKRCFELGIDTKMKFYQKEEQLKLF